MVLPSFYRTARPLLKNAALLEGRDPLETARGYLSQTRLKDPLNIYYYGLIKSFLPDDLLYKNERAASASGVVNRTPFIDHRIIELALKIPEKYKVESLMKTVDGTKIVYKRAITGIIPDQILNRKNLAASVSPQQNGSKINLKMMYMISSGAAKPFILTILILHM